MIVDGLLAYIGPGPGLSMAWAFFALLGTIGLAILSLLLWPFRVLIRRFRGVEPTPDEPATTTLTSERSDTPPESR